MTDVFISHARAERPLAKELAEKLGARGLKVWWDTELIAGEQYRKVLATQLEEAKAVIVLWSPTSVESRWVADEADVAASKGKIISTLCEGCTPKQLPLGLRGFQTVAFGDDAGIVRALQRLGLSLESQANGAASKSAPISDSEREETAWKFVLEKRDAALVESFLREFPNSRHASEVKRRGLLLSKLNQLGFLTLLAIAGCGTAGLLMTDSWGGAIGGAVVGFLLAAGIAAAMGSQPDKELAEQERINKPGSGEKA